MRAKFSTWSGSSSRSILGTVKRSVPASLSMRAAPKRRGSTVSAPQERQNLAAGVHLAHQKQRTSRRTACPQWTHWSPGFQSGGCGFPQASQSARMD